MMKMNDTDELTPLRNEVRALRAMIQFLVIILIISAAAMLQMSAGRAPHFDEMFSAMFKGQPLPTLTEIFLNYGQALSWGFIGSSIILVMLIVVLNRKVWPPAIGLLWATVGIVFAQFAKESLYLPIKEIIQNLT